MRVLILPNKNVPRENAFGSTWNILFAPSAAKTLFHVEYISL
jgi:hypothetical protein